jgi:SAM-dependent methyltransferase/AcrR family transcriptional regulator
VSIYRSTLRAEKAAATRARVITTAGECFATDGYTATTLTTIAARAGVSVETVQATGAKRTLLMSAFDQVHTGGPDQHPMTNPAEMTTILTDSDTERALRRLAHLIAASNARVSPLWLASTAAATSDQDIDGHQRAHLARLRAWTAQLVTGLVAQDRIQPVRAAADLLWHAQLPDSRQRLVADAGWTQRDYADWLADTFVSLCGPHTTDAVTADILTGLDTALWSLAALVSTLREALTAGATTALAADPARTAVLAAAGLVHPGPTLDPALRLTGGPIGRARVDARLAALRQAVAVAAGDTMTSWAEQSDEVLLRQGNASAGTGYALATNLVPALDGLAARLDLRGARMLDVGTGVGALALAVARTLPRVEVVGIDVAARPLALAATAIAAAPDVADRVSLRQQDVAELTDRDAFDLVWLPAPFLGVAAFQAGLARVSTALRPGGWVVVGTNPWPNDRLAATVAKWNAVRGGGNDYDTEAVAEALTAAGLGEQGTFPTVPGGPVLVAARRPLTP